MPFRAQRSRVSLLGALLAVIAMFGLVALSGWHNALVHDHDRIEAVSIEHYEGGSAIDADGSGPVHFLAHAIGHWVALANVLSTWIGTIDGGHVWIVAASFLCAGTDPAMLLRPPRR